MAVNKYLFEESQEAMQEDSGKFQAGGDGYEAAIEEVRLGL